MNLKQWQRSKKIKAEADAAAKRTVERVLNTVKETTMSEFREFEPKFDDWWEENYMNVSADRTEAFDIYSLGLKHQQTKVDELQKRVEWLEDRLKATDTLSKMRAAVIGSFNSQELNARTRRKMMILKRAEQALKGKG